ncbi:ComEC/Rec2 family competence protein [Methyloceanibacter methanicus]|uniref:ComEC/Rec2 family competence protein n=1 Tax=Methyloceanibacter methanicus TaxID=1774968 RepID=UPI003CC7AF2C
MAGGAVAPFAVYHFHRMTHYGIAANMIAAPLISLLIMPMALLSLIAMPFGWRPGRSRPWGLESGSWWARPNGLPPGPAPSRSCPICPGGRSP